MQYLVGFCVLSHFINVEIHGRSCTKHTTFHSPPWARLSGAMKFIYLFIYYYLFISRFVHIEYIQVLEQKDIASPTRFNHLPNPINLETI